MVTRDFIAKGPKVKCDMAHPNILEKHCFLKCFQMWGSNCSVFIMCLVWSGLCVVQVQGFFSRLKERGSQMRSVQEALETIRLNQRWMDKNLPTLQKFL